MEEPMTTIQSLPVRMFLPLSVAATIAACTASAAENPTEASAESSAARGRTVQVAGTAVHYFTTGVIHSETPAPSGKVLRSSEIIRLAGDLDGYILYHPTSTFDFVTGTLVNTGTQIFSGTIVGSPPMILHDDRFRFTVDLATGATVGEVHLSRSNDAPHPGSWFDCDLDVVGTGSTAAGDALADYTGTCTERGSGR
jgi:hypothetical protein